MFFNKYFLPVLILFALSTLIACAPGKTAPQAAHGMEAAPTLPPLAPPTPELAIPLPVGSTAVEPTPVTVKTVDSEQIGIVDAGGGPEFGPESGGGLPDGDVGGGAPETAVQQQAQAVWETHADGSRHCLANCPTGNHFEPVEGAPMGQLIPGAPQPQWETRADGVTVCTANCGGSDETQAAGDMNRGGGFQEPQQ